MPLGPKMDLPGGFHFYDQSELIQGILFWQLLLQFYVYSFEILQVFRSWFEDVHIIWK